LNVTEITNTYRVREYVTHKNVKYRCAPISADSVSAVYHGPKDKIKKLQK
jgi:hypothetical protein